MAEDNRNNRYNVTGQYRHMSDSIFCENEVKWGRIFMLKIWYYANIYYMKDALSYFDNVYEDEWIEDTFVKKMIQDVDHCVVISPHIIDSPILGR